MTSLCSICCFNAKPLHSSKVLLAIALWHTLDNSGATLFHHAVEKGNTNVLQCLLRLNQADRLWAVEIADNAGRTPIFEAVDNNAPAELVRLLLQKRAKKKALAAIEGGFGVQANVVNYNG